MNRLPAALLSTLEIKRSARRKSIGVRFFADRIQVSTPAAIDQQQLLDLLAEKQHWLTRRFEQAQQRFGDCQARAYRTGALMPYLGRDYPLQVREGNQTRVALCDQQLQVVLSRRGRRPIAERAKEALSHWYQAQALALLARKSQILADQLGESVASVKVKHTRSKWGHCTSAGHLQYNWLIVQAPEAIVDYLVAHEVCHLRHLNHSKAFWALVAKFEPDYAASRRWLKQQGHQLRM